LILQIIEPLWTTKTETASRLRGRVESILDWATARNYRTGDNPARWRGHLQRLLPARANIAPVEHHAALPYAELPAFMAQLRRQDGTAARCLELAILTATRSGEVRGARWSEIDLEAKTWRIPAARMKSGKDHTVPLSDSVVLLLRKLPRSGEIVFEGARAGRPLGNMAPTLVLRSMGRTEITAHGFRSTFTDWANETTSHAHHVVEMALAHAIGNGVEAAYRRGDLLAKRRELMDDWAGYCAG
jgi:integrase